MISEATKTLLHKVKSQIQTTHTYTHIHAVSLPQIDTVRRSEVVSLIQLWFSHDKVCVPPPLHQYDPVHVHIPAAAPQEAGCTVLGAPGGSGGKPV